jgi:putative redox protein
MTNPALSVSVNLLNQKVQFSGVARDNQPITVDYYPPLGDGQGYTSLELLLISFSTCVGTAVLALLKKMRKEITGFQINASGVRRETHPTSFETITLDITLHSKDTTDDELTKALKLSEDSICPVWAMIKGNVTVKIQQKIIA